MSILKFYYEQGWASEVMDASKEHGYIPQEFYSLVSHIIKLHNDLSETKLANYYQKLLDDKSLKSFYEKFANNCALLVDVSEVFSDVVGLDESNRFTISKKNELRSLEAFLKELEKLILKYNDIYDQSNYYHRNINIAFSTIVYRDFICSELRNPGKDPGMEEEINQIKDFINKNKYQFWIKFLNINGARILCDFYNNLSRFHEAELQSKYLPRKRQGKNAKRTFVIKKLWQVFIKYNVDRNVSKHIVAIICATFENAVEDVDEDLVNKLKPDLS